MSLLDVSPLAAAGLIVGVGVLCGASYVFGCVSERWLHRSLGGPSVHSLDAVYRRGWHEGYQEGRRALGAGEIEMLERAWRLP